MTYKNRRVVLEIDLTELQEFDAFDLGKVFQSLPEDTKIVSFGSRIAEAKLTMCLENPNFRSIDESLCYPGISIRELPTSHLTTTLTAQHFENPEGYAAKCYEADQRELALDDVNFDPIIGHFSFDEMHDHYLDSIKYVMGVSKVDMENKTVTLKSIPYETMCLDNSKEAFGNSGRIYYSNISAPESFPEAMLKNNTCTHSWKHYIGLTQEYDFCELCDEKRT